MEESSTTTPATESGEMTEGSSSGEPDELSCEAYCDTYLDACTDFSEYANEEHCMDHCGQWPLGAIGETAGDSLGCRSYHVTVASTTDPELHCAHAGPSGDMMCVSLDPPTCDLYCQRYFDYCPDLLNLWESMEMCMSECATWYPGSDSDTGGHTIGCRAYYANLAASDPEANCPNAGPGGGEACVFGG